MVPGSGDWAELLSIVCPWSSAQTTDPLGHHPLGHYPLGHHTLGHHPWGHHPLGHHHLSQSTVDPTGMVSSNCFQLLLTAASPPGTGQTLRVGQGSRSTGCGEPSHFQGPANGARDQHCQAAQSHDDPPPGFDCGQQSSQPLELPMSPPYLKAHFLQLPLQQPPRTPPCTACTAHLRPRRNWLGGPPAAALQ